MMKLTRKDILVAKRVDELKLRLCSFNGDPVVSIGHYSLGGVVGVLFPDSRDEAVIGDFFVRVNEEGVLIAKVLWTMEFDDDDECDNFYEEVDVTDFVTTHLTIDDPCFENFRSACEHPEWHEYYMSTKSFKFLRNVFRKEEETEEE